MGLDMIMLMVLDQQPLQEIITIPVIQTPVQQLHQRAGLPAPRKLSVASELRTNRKWALCVGLPASR